MALTAPARPLKERRFALLATLTLAGFAVVALGLLRLQVVERDEYQRLAQENRVRLEILRAPRGAIYDRNGLLLADNTPSFNIVFRPLPAESTRAARAIRSEWLERVAALVEQDSVGVRQRVAFANRSGQTAVLRRSAPPEVLAGVEEWRGELPGLEVQVEPLRHYPNGMLAAHLLGYAGEINDTELDTLSDDGYRLGDLIGRTGVEHRYEDLLRGENGAEFVVVNAMGKRVSTLSEGPPRPPKPGHDLVLTIDLKVQRAMEDAMASVERGAAVAIDPRDGGILGLVSRPEFDPNEFSRGLSYERWEVLSSGGADPLLDRAISGSYPPGSTFKVVSMLAALRYGVLTPRGHEPVSCTGSYLYGGRRFACWNHKGHGSLDLITALELSCDVFFYQIGPRLGLPRLEATARALGLGSRSGVDLPAEARGLVPSTAYYDRRWGAGKWRPGLLLNLAIGQGELLVTPLQLALMAAEVADRGRPLRPHVVREVRGASEFEIERPTQQGMQAEPAVWDAVQSAMQLVVDAGTATAARIPGVPVAGKTGTSQNPHGKDHALFVCYAPADRPTIALAVIAENSGHGGSVAAPIAAKILRRMFLPDSLQHAPIAHAPALRVPAAIDTTRAGDED